MSELKVIDLGNIRESIENNEPVYYEYYAKSEADKVITELEMKLAASSLVLRLDKPKALYSNLDTMSRLNHKMDVVERRELHQKYKRCLTMYRYCSIKALYELDFKGNDVEWKWYSKWMHKWFKLAEKFKEVK